MTHKLSHILLRAALAVVWLGVAAACAADDLLPAGAGGVVDGSMRSLAVEVTFEAEPAQTLDTGASRAADTAVPGNSIQNVDHLRILIYDAESEAILHNLVIVEGGRPRPTGIITNVSVDNADNRLPDEKDKGLADKSTGKVTFNISLPSARYYIYAVANAADITASQVADRQAMKNIARRWVPGDIAANSEMFGIFSVGPDRGATDATPLSVTNSMVSLHCWLRRLASKVTVAFDGTDLYDNVFVYIDSISLRDIPQQCLLGNPNKAGRDYSSDNPEAMLAHDAATRYAGNSNGLISHGPYDLVQDLSDIDGKILLPETYLHVCNGAHAYLGAGKEGDDPSIITARHSHEARSLFFYENLQGRGKDGCKKQDANGDNHIDNAHPVEGDVTSGWKDGKPYGTYVEVHGHYRCTAHDGNVSAGPIVYRFMLGKDTDHDFDAERNTHYQLTLQLKGYGNDADWHIEYKYHRGITVSSPQFISYLYNKKMMASIKVAGEIPDGYYLRADIMDDEGTWRPWGDGTEFLPSPKPGFTTSEKTADDGPWNSFLSLRKTQVIKIEAPDKVGAPSNKYTWAEARSTSIGYYNDNHVGTRVYQVTPSENGYEGNGQGESGVYFVSATRKSGEVVTERMFSVPLYTRAKELVTRSGFTGNNPFSQYSRKQRVRFSLVTSTDPDADYASVAVSPSDPYYIEPVYLDVIQVPRIVNPKAIWRKAGSKDGFHVRLMQLNPNDSKNFYVFRSQGKWSAEVVSASAPIVTLTTTEAGSGAGNVQQTGLSRIEGESEHPVDFMINFNGMTGYAAVRVRYHNNSCEHDIFVCNGYEQPVDLVGNGTRWSQYNVDYFDGDSVVLAKDPRQEGSLFRRGCSTAILASNNTSSDVGVRHNASTRTFAVKYSNGTTGNILWSAVKPVNTATWSITNTGLRIATGDDFYSMIASNANDINFQINKAYGVLYGQGAKETQQKVAEAYEYNSLTGEESVRGMRGVLIYNTNTLRQLFLPIGQSGHGHRKTGGGWRNNDTDGTLRYAGRSDVVSSSASQSDKEMNMYAPLFYDLYIRPGAIYWLRDYVGKIPDGANGYPDNKKSSAFDINFFTMGFEGYSNDAVPAATNSHACFIRTVCK